MKQYILSICVVLATSNLFGQELPKGVWNIVTDDKGNSIGIKSSGNGPRQVTSYDFRDGTKYSFSFEEYDSSGRRILAVKENGVYSFTASQFVLTPSVSTTSFYDYIPNSSRPVGNSVKQNSLSPASYNWTYQKAKEEKLMVEAVKPGFREGFISVGTKAWRPLPAAVRRSLARAM